MPKGIYLRTEACNLAHQCKGGISLNQKEYRRKWQEKNKKHRQQYRQENKEHIKDYQREWQKNNIEKKRNYNKKRRAKKKGAIGSHTLGEWELLKKQYGFICPACRKEEPQIKLTEDHIIPISKGGSNYIENIQPLCHSCNCKKYTEIIKYGGKE